MASGERRRTDPERPNVVLLLSDDHGAWAMGCAGNTEIRTPNLDRLATAGVRATNFFCTSPVCSPARASILTGRIPSQHGVLDWIRSGNHEREGKVIEYLAGQTGYTDLLSAAGYVCGVSGKWHLGASDMPQKSFAHWYTYPGGAGTYRDPEMYRGTALTQEQGYVTDLITDDALGFIESAARDGRPFYASIHYTAPHSPWLDQHPQEIFDSYEDCAFRSCPQEPKRPGVNYSDFAISYLHSQRRDRPIEEIPRREYLKGYFAAVTAMDASIGRVVERLERLGLRENTLLIYMGDNGFNCGHHGIWGKGNTFPMNMFDTSIKVPAIFSHPGRIRQGVTTDALLSGYDLMPTLLDHLGLPHPGSMDLPGRSFAALLEGHGLPQHDAVVVFDEYGPVRMIRTHEWKYVHRYPYGPHELYDLLHDPDERRNCLEDSSPAIVMSLKGTLDEWFVRYADPAYDGTHEAVAGRGQLALAGPAGRGAKAFHEPEAEPYRTADSIR